MIDKNSRYRDCQPFEGEEGAPAPFKGVRARAIGPATPVLEHVWNDTDRLDLLADHYYGDPQLWWRILDANPDLLCGGDLPGQRGAEATDGGAGMSGRIVLIPRARE